MSNLDWHTDSPRLIALLCSSQGLRFAVLAQSIEHIRALRPDPLAQLREMLRQRCIADGSCNTLSQRILCRPQIAGRSFPLAQLLIGGGAVPEGYRPLQTVGLDRARRQQRNPGVKSIQCLFWLVRNRQQGNAIFVVGHDARHTLARRAAFGFIDLRLASRDGFCVLRLQQLGTGRAGSLSSRRPQGPQRNA
jgi:hypothetical protein